MTFSLQGYLTHVTKSYQKKWRGYDVVKVGSPKTMTNHFAKALVMGHCVKQQVDLDWDMVFTIKIDIILTMWIYVFY